MGTHKACRDTGTDRPAGCHRTIVGASLVGALGGKGGVPPKAWRPRRYATAQFMLHVFMTLLFI